MDVVLTQGDLLALIKLVPEDFEQNPPPTVEALKDFLEQNGVVHGILEENLERLAVVLSGSADHDGRHIPVAQGTPPVPGEDARIQHRVNLDQKVGELLPGDRIDYRERNLVKNVHKDDLLAEKIPPGEGTPGISVTGQEISAPPGKDIKLVPTENTIVSPDGVKLRANIDGMLLSKVDGNLYVSDEFVIRGDVDYSVGNVKTVGKVTIEGDVLSGFRVNTRKDVTINGTVEDATIKAGGDVKVRYGMTGKNVGIIEAGGSIRIMFASNTNLRAEGDITVLRQVLHSTVVTKGRLIVDRARGLIAGGNILARQGVEAREIGASVGTPTLISVGVDPDMLAQLTTVKHKLGELGAEIEKIDTMLRAARKKGKQNGLSENKKEILKRVLAERKRAVSNRDSLKEEKESLEERILPDLRATVRVQGAVHPGVIIRYHDVEFAVTEALKNVTFSFNTRERKITLSGGALENKQGR